KKARHNLARLRWTKTTGTSSARTTSTRASIAFGTTRTTTARSSRSAAGTARTTGPALPAPTCRIVRLHPGRQGPQLFLGDDPIFVGVGLIEDPQQPFVRHLVPR